jgi:putative pyruvate formate lyase activating enzyme
MLNLDRYKNCTLCPRDCRVDRTAGKTGICGETAELRVSSIEAHHGEEPPISGSHGSGTVFFTGCSLKCDFCQNYQISCFYMGSVTTVQAVADKLEQLYRQEGIHNINFVTADHFLPHTIEIVSELRWRQIPLPILYNTSGYMKVDSLRELELHADIYMPDYKYADANLAQSLSRCRDYPTVALDAIAEMVRQKGFLDSFLGKRQAATKGAFVRHLVLPGQVQNSIDALSILFNEFGRELPISLMSQYWPARMVKIAALNRRVTAQEFYRVYDHAIDLGFANMFVQHISDLNNDDEFAPDFRRRQPFKGNIR